MKFDNEYVHPWTYTAWLDAMEKVVKVSPRAPLKCSLIHVDNSIAYTEVVLKTLQQKFKVLGELYVFDFGVA